MPWFLVEREEIHTSTMLVQADNEQDAAERVDEGTEVKCEYSSTPDDGGVETVRKMTQREAAEYVENVLSEDGWDTLLPDQPGKDHADRLRDLVNEVRGGK